MKSVDAGSWSGNWAWSLPLIVLNVVIHVIGLGLINESIVRVVSGARERRRSMPTFAVVMGRRCLVGYRTARDRGGHLGHRLLASRRPTRHQVCDALFAQRNDKLRPREPLSGKAMATYGCSGGSERDASVRADRFSVCHDSEGLAAGK
jgi:hypothetical protein